MDFDKKNNMEEVDNQKISKTNNWGFAIVFGCVFLLLLLRYCDQHKHDKYRSTFKGETIGFATRFKHYSKSTYIKYYFYSGERIVGSMLVPGSNDSRLNKFYKVKYDLGNPKANYIVLEKEIKPDSITLVKAGFTRTKYYIYDAGVTCKYIEKLKWK